MLFIRCVHQIRDRPIWAVFKYTDTKEKEFYTYYWNQKFELFFETRKVASQMSTTESLMEFDTARSTYFELFYGRLSLVKGDPVKPAMEKFIPVHGEFLIAISTVLLRET